jgi:hypothetical protein
MGDLAKVSFLELSGDFFSTDPASREIANDRNCSTNLPLSWFDLDFSPERRSHYFGAKD